MSGAGLHGLCLSRPSSRPCSWPPPHPALHTGDTVNEVMSLRPAELQPDKGFIGFVKLAPCGQGPPGTRQHHRGKKEKQTMKLKGISFPELRLSHAHQEHVSPWFLPLLFFFFPVPGLCGAAMLARVTTHAATRASWAAILGHLAQESKPRKDFWEEKTCERYLRGLLVHSAISGHGLITSPAEDGRPQN